MCFPHYLCIEFTEIKEAEQYWLRMPTRSYCPTMGYKAVTCAMLPTVYYSWNADCYDAL